MRKICGWCHTVMRDEEAADGLVSHGLCEACADWMAGNDPGRTLDQFLSGLNATVLVVNDQARVVDASQALLRALDQDMSGIAGEPAGIAVECAFARLPEGCGNTTHCPACAIRRSITETHRTGVPQEDVPATLNVQIDGQPETLRLRVSAWKKDDLVLLRIDSGLAALSEHR